MKSINPFLLTDFYKVGREGQYPKNTTRVYEVWTPRGSRMPGVDNVVFFGLQAFVKKYLIDFFNKEFFEKDIDDIVKEYKRVTKATLGSDLDTSHIENLHKIGYLPLKICAVKEGTETPTRVPQMTIENTHKDAFWLPNFLETILSSELWQPCTTATIAKQYRLLSDKYAEKTADNSGFVDFQCHGFEMRGMGGSSGFLNSGAGHLLSFRGSDTVPAYNYFENYYNADVEKELVITSIPATEHLVETMYESDEEYIRSMIEDAYPTGLVSIVMDGYSYWDVVSETLPKLKEKIMARDGKMVVRGDSGNPVDIICGIEEFDTLEDRDLLSTESKGTVEMLWDIFGGTINEKGYKVLDSHVGAIYGDSITIDRAEAIFKRLERKGFSSENIVLGVGSYTYQYNTRDTFMYALKTTYGVIDGKETMIYKDPKTDDGTKKSQKGMVNVFRDESGQIKTVDGLNEQQRQTLRNSLLEQVFLDGKLLRDESLADIRKRVMEA